MSEIKVNKITPRTNCGSIQLGDSGDTFTLPSGATITVASGATISNSGTAAGFGGTGEISWDTTVKTTGTFTATAGVGYFLNTTGGTITVDLPAGSAGDSVAMADYAGTWQTSNVTVSPNGSEKMGGIPSDVILSTEGQAVTFVYIDGTQGWVNVLDSTSNVRGNPYLVATGGTITTSGNCKIHTFTGPGTFTVSQISTTAAENTVSHLVLAGGAGGGSNGGGGGAGGFREVKSPLTPYTASPLDGYPSAPNRVTVTATSFPITVGGGGAGGGPGANIVGTNGVNSTFSTVTSAGGGGGGKGNSPMVGTAGGSGGGAGRDGSGAAGGAGNTPPVSPAQGFAGGASQASSYGGGGGGGGATAVGADGTGGNPSNETGGNGGAGATTSITASPATRAGGGGGGVAVSSAGGTRGTGGSGGGGTGGGTPSAHNATNAVANEGGGGGGGSDTTPTYQAGNGGSGIVVIRYKYQ
tara:strand:+ start:3227 stop:4633 length:1407 start_codon:yes stop_codon:yes gene_type:complete